MTAGIDDDTGHLVLVRGVAVPEAVGAGNAPREPEGRRRTAYTWQLGTISSISGIAASSGVITW